MYRQLSSMFSIYFDVDRRVIFVIKNEVKDFLNVLNILLHLLFSMLLLLLLYKGQVGCYSRSKT